MQQTCKQCSAAFEITDEDLKFYEDVSPVFNGKKELIPPPTLCPNCRLQRRMAFRNDRILHYRKSDLSGKQIISIYSADKPYIVYDQDEWWGDEWNALDYGRDFDFGKTFAEQFDELSRAVPHVSLYTTNNENSYYTNHTLNCKNCYLIAGGGNDEDCLYGRYIVSCKTSVDGASLYSCERCYEGIASEGCYGCVFFRYSRNCSDCLMIEDCQSCKHCIGCFGLRQKEYCINNEQLTKEEYERRASELQPLTREKITRLEEMLASLKIGLPHRHAHLYSSEDCSGDMIVQSKNTHWAFDVSKCEDSKFLSFTPKGIHSYDCTFNAPDGVEWCYEAGSSVGSRSCLTTFLIWYGNNMLYSTECHHSNDCFGCVGLRNKQYCIFNKQYSKEEYEQLVPKIIEHMRNTGEWGEYFPTAISRFGYNESVAQDFFPLNEEEAASRGWKWNAEENERKNYLGPVAQVPETIQEVGDDICDQILLCEATGKPYKITAQELKFYREMGIPLPRRCPDRRFRDRIALRNPRSLWKRACMNCGKEIETSYSPERQEIVYCESCYLQSVY